MDNLVYEQSLQSNASKKSPFKNKEWRTAIDNNNSSYNQPVTFDTAQFSNSEEWINLKEGYVVIPVVMGAYVPNTAGTAMNNNSPFLMGLKSGFWNMISQLSFQIDGKEIIPLTSNLNMYASFIANTTWSHQDMLKYGTLTGFNPDTSTSYGYVAVAGTSGIRGFNNVNNITNTITTGAGASAFFGFGGNKGLFERQKSTSFNLGGANDCQLLSSEGFVKSALRSYFKVEVAQTTSVWRVTMVVRLKDLHPFFDAVPLIKGQKFKLTLYTNQCTCSVRLTNVADASPTAMTLESTTFVNGGNTCPFMVASMAANNGGVLAVGTLTANNAVTYSLGIASITLNNVVYTHGLSACRLVIPSYAMHEQDASDYIEQNKNGIVVPYIDIVSNLLTGVTTSFQWNMYNSLQNVKRVILLPFYARTTCGFDIFASPFASEPATTSCFPGLALSNLQIQIGGKNMFANTVETTYEMFCQELGKTGINGDSETGLTSGLISKLDYELCYQYIVCDVSRRTVDGEGLSVTAIGKYNQVGANMSLDLYAFVEVEKKVVLDVYTSRVLDSST